MPTCPRCQQSVTATAIECPTCQLTLKAHGHPGIDLHRAEGSESLCDTCTYHFDNTCNFPQRPLAQTCTLYQDQRVPLAPMPTYTIPWWRRYAGWLALAALVLLSLLIALFQ